MKEARVDPKKLATLVPFLLSLAAAALLISAGTRAPEAVGSERDGDCLPRAFVEHVGAAPVC